MAAQDVANISPTASVATARSDMEESSRWANMYDDWRGDSDGEDVGFRSSAIVTVSLERSLEQPAAVSAGSQLHSAGRCKPCAFFHTKGCQSGTDCVFCHLCPPNEKQRRKRDRKVCHYALLGPRRRDSRVGHKRQISGASATTASSSQYNHSRNSSASMIPDRPEDRYGGGAFGCLDVDEDGASMSAGHDQMAAQCFAYGEPASPEQMVAGFHAPVMEPMSYVVCNGIQYAMVPVPMMQPDGSDCMYGQVGQMYDPTAYDPCWPPADQMAGPSMVGAPVMGPNMLEQAFW